MDGIVILATYEHMNNYFVLAIVAFIIFAGFETFYLLTVSVQQNQPQRDQEKSPN